MPHAEEKTGPKGAFHNQNLLKQDLYTYNTCVCLCKNLACLYGPLSETSSTGCHGFAFFSVQYDEMFVVRDVRRILFS